MIGCRPLRPLRPFCWVAKSRKEMKVVIPTEAKGRREAYQGFSNASPDLAVTTHV